MRAGTGSLNVVHRRATSRFHATRLTPSNDSNVERPPGGGSGSRTECPRGARARAPARPRSRHAATPRAHSQAGELACFRADHGGERHGEAALRDSDLAAVGPPAVPAGQLRRVHGVACRERPLRPPEGGLHGRHEGPRRNDRAGGRRCPLSRRGAGAAAEHAGEAAARAGDRRVPAAGRGRDEGLPIPSARRDERGSRAANRAGTVSSRSVPPPRGAAAPRPAAARAAR